MKQIPVSVLTLIAGILVTVISLWVGQNHGLLPEQASVQAPLVDNLFDVMMTISVALFLIMQGAILWFMIRYRQRKGDNADGDPSEGNLSLEIVWTAIPAVLVIGLGIYSVEVYSEMGGFAPEHASMMMGHNHGGSAVAHVMGDSAIAGSLSDDPNATGEEIAYTYGIGATPAAEANPADLEVNVAGMQYAWIFTYPKGGMVSGELHVPVGRQVQLNISATDVIHSFWVPQFRLKQDAIPGQPTQLRFEATKPGDYPVVCAELCGGYHGSMRTRVIVHEAEEYDQWEAEQIALQNDGSTVAAIPVPTTALSPTEYLSPYSEDIAIAPEVLADLH